MRTEQCAVVISSVVWLVISLLLKPVQSPAEESGAVVVLLTCSACRCDTVWSTRRVCHDAAAALASEASLHLWKDRHGIGCSHVGHQCQVRPNACSVCSSRGRLRRGGCAIHKRMQRVRARVRACTCVPCMCVCVSVCVCMCAYMCVPVFVRAVRVLCAAHAHAYMCLCVHACCVCACTQARTHECMHARTSCSTLSPTSPNIPSPIPHVMLPALVRADCVPEICQLF